MKSINLISYLIILFPIAIVLGQAPTHTLSAAIALYFISYLVITKKLHYLKKKYIYFFFIYFCYLIFTSIVGSNPYLSFESTLFYFRFIFLSLGVYIILKQDHNIFYKLFFLLFLILVFLSIDGIYQFFFKVNLFGIVKTEPDRIAGIFGDEYILGSFISRIFPFFLFLYFYNFKETNKYFYLILFILFILFFLTILMSGDRIAVIYFTLTSIILFICFKNSRRYFYFSILIIFICLIFINFYDESIKYRFIDRTFKSDFQIQYGITNIKFFSDTHEQHFMTAYQIFKDNIFFGSGPKTFRLECLNYKDIYFHGCSTHPHNTYLQLLSEVGIIGVTPIFIIFLMLIKKIFFSIYKFNNNILQHSKLNIFFYVFFLIPLLPFLPSSNFFSNYLNSIYYFTLGVFIYYDSKN